MTKPDFRQNGMEATDPCRRVSIYCQRSLGKETIWRCSSSAECCCWKKCSLPPSSRVSGCVTHVCCLHFPRGLCIISHCVILPADCQSVCISVTWAEQHTLWIECWFLNVYFPCRDGWTVLDASRSEALLCLLFHRTALGYVSSCMYSFCIGNSTMLHYSCWLSKLQLYIYNHLGLESVNSCTYYLFWEIDECKLRVYSTS